MILYQKQCLTISSVIIWWRNFDNMTVVLHMHSYLYEKRKKMQKIKVTWFTIRIASSKLILFLKSPVSSCDRERHFVDFAFAEQNQFVRLYSYCKTYQFDFQYCLPFLMTLDFIPNYIYIYIYILLCDFKIFLQTRCLLCIVLVMLCLSLCRNKKQTD